MAAGFPAGFLWGGGPPGRGQQPERRLASRTRARSDPRSLWVTRAEDVDIVKQSGVASLAMRENALRVFKLGERA